MKNCLLNKGNKMQEDKELETGTAEFFRKEILNTRIVIDNIRRDYLLKNESMFCLHEQNKFQIKKPKKLTTRST